MRGFKTNYGTCKRLSDFNEFSEAGLEQGIVKGVAKKSLADTLKADIRDHAVLWDSIGGYLNGDLLINNKLTYCIEGLLKTLGHPANDHKASLTEFLKVTHPSTIKMVDCLVRVAEVFDDFSCGLDSLLNQR